MVRRARPVARVVALIILVPLVVSRIPPQRAGATTGRAPCRGHHAPNRATLPTTAHHHRRRRRRPGVRGAGGDVDLGPPQDLLEPRITDDEVRYLLAAQDALRQRRRADEDDGAELVPGWLRSTSVSLSHAYRAWLDDPLLVPADTIHRLLIESHAGAQYWIDRGLDGASGLRALHEDALTRMYLDALDLEPAQAAMGALVPPLTVTGVGLEEVYAKVAEAERYLHVGTDPRFRADARLFRDVLERVATSRPVWLHELLALRENATSGERRRLAEDGADDYAESRVTSLDLLDRLAGERPQIAGSAPDDAVTKSPQIAARLVRGASSLTRRVYRQRAGNAPESPAMASQETHHQAVAAEADLIARNLRAAIAAAAPPLNTSRGVANAIGVGETQFSRWITRDPRRRNRPSAAHLHELNQLFGKPHGWFRSEHPELEHPE